MPIPFVRPATAVLLAVFVATLAVTTIYHIRDDLFHPLVLIDGIFAYFVVIPAIAKFVGDPRVEANISRYSRPDEMLFLAVGALLAAYLVICAGFYAVGRVGGGTTNDATDTANSRSQQSRPADSFAARISPRALFWLGIAGFVVGAAFFVFYVVINGGFMRMLTVQPRGAFQTIPDTGRWRWVGLAGLFGGLITALAGVHPVLSRNGPNWSLSRVEKAAFVVCAVGVGIATLALRGRMFIAIFGAFVLVYARSTGRVTDRTLAAAGAVVVALGATFSAVEAAFFGGSAYQLFVRGVLQVARLDVFMGLLYQVPANAPYQWGSTLVGAIPVQWPGQPPVYGQQLDLLFGDDRPHILLSAMLPGELYLNAGPIGLLVGATIYGAALRAVYRLRAARGWLARGLYPIALVALVFYWPTNIAFATKTFVVRMLLPVCVALVAAVAWERLKYHFDWRHIAATDD